MEVFKYNKERIKKINKFMKRLIDSNNTKEKVNLYNEYLEEIKNITPIDIFYLDFYSNHSNLSIQEVKKTANKFVNVFHKGLEKHVKDYKHILLKTLVLENNKIEEHLNELKKYYKNKDLVTNKKALLKGLNECLAFEKKFIKYENIIFPNLENKLPSNRPFEVLWELHDDARCLLKTIIENLKKDNIDKSTIIKQIGEYYFLIYGINQKEELIILPLLNQIVSNEKLNLLYNECLDYQFVFINERKPIDENTEIEYSNKLFKTKTGELDFKQLELVLNKIPIDITFVDNNDTVRYYNNRLERHFPRNPSVIGRLVKHCHPPKSIKIVEKIIDDFRNEKRDFADFWIEIKGTFLYIIYYAIRDEENRYLGVLEVSQDITKLRELSGEKRLDSGEKI
ncbi:MAG: PAS domain-containing protein [Candidatus Izimaplasma sp.]|nr:PAS domain-containing protein [Candidatus Izimaplasma bacterium]